MKSNHAEQQEDTLQTDEAVTALQQMRHFEDLPVAALEEFAVAGIRRDVGAGETVFTMNQYDGEELHCILKGEAQLTGVAAETGELAVEDLAAGDIVGLEFVLGNREEQAYQTGLVATSDLRIFTIDSEVVRQAVKKKPAVARAFLGSFARQLLRSRTARDLPKADPQQRIIAALFDMVERDKADASVWRIAAMPKHRELGEIAGATEVEAAEAVARLISEGIARRDYPGLVIADYNKLHALAMS